MAIKKSDLYSSLWASCDQLRGGMDASQYKDYVLFMLFIKYVSDKYADYDGFEPPVVIPPGASFKDMIALKGKSDIGDKINTQIIQPLIDANSRLARTDFPNFNDPNQLGEGQAMGERRIVDMHTSPLAAVFFSWKLKPTEQRLVSRNRRQIPLFGEPLPIPAPMLRVDYAIVSEAFERRCSGHIPKDKSVPSDGPIHAASVTQTLQDGDIDLDLGTVAGRFAVHVLPVFTVEDATGPDGASSVVAIIRPL